MANGRNKKQKGDAGRDAGGFSAIPWTVLDSLAYRDLSHPARSLLLELARQFVRDNNGRLLLSTAYLSGRGWNSNSLVTRAKRDLLAAGFIHETVKGHRPNKASWYAVTWRTLDRLPGYDFGAAENFERGAYRKNEVLTPAGGVGRSLIAPAGGVGKAPPTPSQGAIKGIFTPASTPPQGDHLEGPSPGGSEPAPREPAPKPALPPAPASAGTTQPAPRQAPGPSAVEPVTPRPLDRLPPAPRPPADKPVTPAIALETVRERDADHSTDQWCEVTGQFIPSTPRPTQAKAQADAWARAALASLKKSVKQ
jgi:hypothetical protein